MSGGRKPWCRSSTNRRSIRLIFSPAAVRAGRAIARTSKNKLGAARRSSVAPAKRRSMTGNNRRGIVLQDRDRHLLTELAVMRIIDREQAKRVAGFGSTTRANTRLLALVRAGLLRRFFIGTTGRATKALYALARAGAELVGVPYRGLRRGSEETLVADYFVHHQLSVNDLYFLMKYQPLPVADAKFSRWLSFYEPIEPGSALIPDGYAEVTIAAKVVPMFIEVDLGTESQLVWKRKVEAYLRY